MRKLTLILSILLLFSSGQVYSATGGYDYPITDPFMATILGTPADLRAPQAEGMKVKVFDLTIFPGRKIPEILWFNAQLRCSLAYQKEKAPLVFLIAGTGSGFNSDTMMSLQNTYYRAGFHVINISSPTHANFIVSASETSAPGVLRDDARDLYRVMQKAIEKVGSKIEVSEYYLAGYSLGGAQAAYVSMIDEEKKIFNFSKVMMINPPVSLYSSAILFDKMLEENVPGGSNNAELFLRELMDKLARRYRAGDFVKFDQNFLYNIYRGLRKPPKTENLVAVIGLTFRLSEANMLFASDVMTHSNFVVPRDFELDNNDPKGHYLRTLLRIPFAKYIDEFLLPIAQTSNPKLRREELIDSASLKSIEGYLKQANKVGVLTNEDDIILAPGEIDYLRQLFGSRAKIYPTGGHCGNINHRDVVEYLTTYFTRP